MRRKSFHRMMLSVLVAISMVAGMGHAASAAAAASIVVHQHAPDMDMTAAMQAGHMMHAPAPPTPASRHYHHDLAGCACCSMACCAATLTPFASVRTASKRNSVLYALLLATGRGVVTALEPDPPRPSTL